MKILVCDDEQKYCYIVKHLIYEILGEFSESVVYTIDSGKQLIEYCNTSCPDILFLDIELGNSNGIELAKTIRNKFPNLIIEYISNYPDYV
ncbi:MAG: response regulator [Clostridiales bacterium]|nr:response regulator [Clostridiales bacterium]